MRTNREIFFDLVSKKNKYLTEYIIKLLLCETCGYIDFTELSIKFDEINKNEDLLLNYSEEIIKGKPYQYVLHKAFFLGDTYYVDENVLIPRQETEQLVIEICKKIEDLQSFCPKIICDVCTGSGVLAIEMSKKYPDSTIIATDIDKKALKVAEKNAKDKGKHIIFREGDLINPIINEFKIDVLVCNPPYIEDELGIDEQVYKFEPHIALLSKPGTNNYEIIFQNLNRIANNSFVAGFEIGEEQQDELTILVNKYLNNVKYEFKIDIYGKTRFLLLWRN